MKGNSCTSLTDPAWNTKAESADASKWLCNQIKKQRTNYSNNFELESTNVRTNLSFFCFFLTVIIYYAHGMNIIYYWLVYMWLSIL